jgi:hypothetical protein
MSSLTRLALYLAYNPLYAKESLKKQGMLFGLHRKAPAAVKVAPEPKPAAGTPIPPPLPESSGSWIAKESEVG